MSAARDDSGARRAWIYLRERFPPLPAALLSFLYTGGGFAVAARLGAPGAGWRLALTSAIVTGFFLCLRLGDEAKDAGRDRVLHPERPVPRGLVSLTELRRAELGVAAACTAASALLGPAALAAWLAVVGYAALMRVEFFAADWLETRPVRYALTHQPVLLLVTAFIHLAAGLPPDRLLAPAVLWHQLVCLTLLFAFEVSRKLRAPGDEHPLRRTYSQVHGPAVAGLLAAGLLAAAVAGTTALLGRAWAGALVLVAPAVLHAVRPSRASGRIADLTGQLALLSLHAALAAHPWSSP